MSIRAHAQALSLDPKIELFDIDLTSLGGSVIYATPMANVLGAARYHRVNVLANSGSAYMIDNLPFVADKPVYLKMIYKKDAAATWYPMLTFEEDGADLARVQFRVDSDAAPFSEKLYSGGDPIEAEQIPLGPDHYALVIRLEAFDAMDKILFFPRNDGDFTTYAQGGAAPLDRTADGWVDVLSLELWTEGTEHQLNPLHNVGLEYWDPLNPNVSATLNIEPQAISPLLWKGNGYDARPIAASGFETAAGGAIPRPKLQIANNFGFVTSLLKQYEDLLGATVTKWTTYRRFLDDGVTADPNAHMPPQIYTIDRKVTHNKSVVEFELASVLDQTGIQLPARQVLRSGCQLQYRIYNSTTNSFDYSAATCPYVGASIFDVNDDVAASDAEDKCSQQLTGCQLRFPTGDIPFGGFPSVGRIS